jgi:carbonic anhydrase
VIIAAIATKHRGTEFRSRVQLLLDSIVPGLPEFDLQHSPAKQLSRAIQSNVRWSVRRIMASPKGQAREAQGNAKIVGAVYDIETGNVRFFLLDE